MSILSLIYRTAGAWGAGKGANLTAEEVDGNFHDLAQAFEDLAASPTQPNQIDHISTAGNTFTVHMEDATTFGPFALPVAAFNFRGAWEAVTDYVAADLFTADSGLYFVNRDFTSGSAFVANLGAGVGGPLPYASLIMPFPNKVRVGFFWPGKPGIGLPEIGSSDDFVPMFGYLVTDAFYLLEDLDGSAARLRRANNDDEAIYNIYQNEIQIGTVTFALGATTGTMVLTSDVNFVEGDMLFVGPPVAIDSEATGLSITFVGLLGEVASSS